jgi:hypothetical protein
MHSEVKFLSLNPSFIFSQDISVKPGDFITLVSGEKNDPVWFAIVVTAPDSNEWFRVCWYAKRVVATSEKQYWTLGNATALMSRFRNLL